MFLTNYQTPYASNWGYDSKMHEDIKEKIESQSNFELSIIDNLNSFKEIIESYHLNSLLNIEVEFQYFKDINLFKEDIEKCLNAGMNMYLSKPVDIFKLLKVLSEFRN